MPSGPDAATRWPNEIGTPPAAWIASRILMISTVISLPVLALAVVAPSSVRPAWDHLHWSAATIGAASAAAWSIRGTIGRTRLVRTWCAVALGLWMLATLVWTQVHVSDPAGIPSMADVLLAAILVPAIGALVATVHGRLSAADEAAVYLDGALGFILIGSVVVLVFGPTAVALPTAAGIAAMVHPIGFLGIAGAGLIAVLAVGQSIAVRGALALVVGCGLIGLAYLGWIGPAMHLSDPGELSSILFTLGTLAAGFGAATWTSERASGLRYLAVARTATGIAGPLIGSILFIVLLLPAPEPIASLVHLFVLIGSILLTLRQGLIVRERTAMLATVTELTRSNRRLVGELRGELEERTRNESRSIETARADAVGSLSANVGHEVNNPLTGILGYAELVLAELPTDHPSRRDVETIREEALRTRGILSALRDFASPRPPHIEPMDLIGVLHGAVLAQRPAASSAGIAIEESFDAIGSVLLDGRAVERSVAGILENACMATPSGGTITVAARRTEDGVEITVADDGIGMDEITVRRALEPFFSAWPASAIAQPATGLGLSIANGLIGSLGGKITFDSSSRGTTVEIRLPVAGGRAADVQTEGGS